MTAVKLVRCVLAIIAAVAAARTAAGDQAFSQPPDGSGTL